MKVNARVLTHEQFKLISKIKPASCFFKFIDEMNSNIKEPEHKVVKTTSKGDTVVTLQHWSATVVLHSTELEASLRVLFQQKLRLRLL